MQFFVQYGIDAILVLLLLLTVVISAQKGFIKCVLSLVCVVAAMLLASEFSKPAADWCYDNILSDIVVSKVEKSINIGYDSQSVTLTVEEIIDTLPDFIDVQLTKLGIDLNVLSENIAQLQLSTEDTAKKISDEIIRPGIIVLLNLIIYLLIFISVRLILGFLSRIIIKIADLPVLKQTNKTLGALAGVIKGLALIVTLSFVFNFLSELLKNTNVFVQSIENSRICDIIKDLI